MLDINAIPADLGLKCLKLLGMHAMNGCGNTSYLFAKCEITTLLINVLLSGDFLGLSDACGKK